MGEGDAVERADAPRTVGSLAHDLGVLGIAPGMTVLVHASLSSLGWVCGGPVAAVQALLDALAPGGTLVMPTHSGDYSEPSLWGNPPVPESWWPVVRETMPAFDPRTAPTRGIGAIAETFRTWPGALRSGHPQVSFAALGPQAERLTGAHALDYSLGEGSPLARLYELDGHVLLLGVGYDRNTSFHLAEYRAPGAPRATQGAPIYENGRRVWKTYADVAFDADVFPEIGADFEVTGAVRLGLIGSASARLFSQRAVVDFATAWIAARRAAR